MVNPVAVAWDCAGAAAPRILSGMPPLEQATVVPLPGATDGPCLSGECGHARCAELRSVAASSCAVCGAPVGYGVTFLAAFGERMHGACLRAPRGARPVLGRFSHP